MCTQKKGIEFSEILSPILKMSSIWVVLGLSSFDLELEQLYVKMAILHGDLKEEICMYQLKGFEIKGKTI